MDDARIPGLADMRLLKSVIEEDDVSTLESLMIDVVDMHAKADLLAVAIKLGKTNCILCLLHFGADPFLKQSDTRRTALYWTVLRDDVDSLQLLLRDIYRDPVDVVFEFSSLASDSSLENMNLARRKKNLSCTASFGNQPEQEKILSYRVRRAMDEAVFEAASLGSLETAKFLILTGANPNIFCYHDDEFLSWCSPLIAACYIPLNSFCSKNKQDAENMVKLLVENGAEVNAKNYVGDTPMHWASACGLCEAILVLLRNGADINARNQLSLTPIQAAVDRNSDDCYKTVELLLEWGASVNDVDASGWSVLCYAVNSANSKVVEMLLERGAKQDYEWERSEKVTMITNPLFIATSLGDRFLIKLLVSYGADVNRKAGSIANPISPFVSCLQMGNFDLAELFLQLGVDRHEAYRSILGYIETIYRDNLYPAMNVTEKTRLIGFERLLKVLSVPLSLMSCCRLIILLNVSQRKIDQLPLPDAIKSFLQFDEVN